MVYRTDSTNTWYILSLTIILDVDLLHTFTNATSPANNAKKKIKSNNKKSSSRDIENADIF